MYRQPIINLLESGAFGRVSARLQEFTIEHILYIIEQLHSHLILMNSKELRTIASFRPYLRIQDTSRSYMEDEDCDLIISVLLTYSILSMISSIELLESIYDVNEFTNLFNYECSVSTRSIIVYTIVQDTGIAEDIINKLLPGKQSP